MVKEQNKKSHLFDGLRRNYLKINYANLFPTSFQFTTFHDAVMQSGGPILVNEELVFSNFPLIAIFILGDFRSFRSYLNPTQDENPNKNPLAFRIDCTLFDFLQQKQ